MATSATMLTRTPSSTPPKARAGGHPAAGAPQGGDLRGGARGGSRPGQASGSDGTSLLLPLRGFVYWSPVWAPLLLTGLILRDGLVPARAERERLQAEEPVVRARHDASSERLERLEAEHAAWQDPVYQERIRRLREAEGQPHERGR